PDWPKCFGYYIPPTDAETLEWQPNREYKKGQVIIVEESLKIASTDFTTGEMIDNGNWKNYTKHDYSVFNVWHTWIEYINRLIGALSGFAILIMAFLSLRKWKTNKKITLLSILSVFLIGFQAWLGATVVYSVLSPVKITIHMVMALVIVAVLLYLLQQSKEITKVLQVSKKYKAVLMLAIVLTVIQVIFGTQVRQEVDEAVKTVGYDQKSLWLENPSLQFYIHRSFSILVLVVNLWLWYVNRKMQWGIKYLNGILLLILAEAFTGILMYYFDFPILSQPLHLVIASLLFGLQFYVLLEVFSRSKMLKSS
ncbi:MAG: heme A synthase, partial [Flavobacteriaceae bacterium]|nr:heme A synthase [Flavobacteriaceae bacterium]